MTELEQQFNDLYQQNADSVFRLCLFKTSNREVAIDLSQDIFTKTWAYLAKGNEVGNLRALLFTIARNRIKDYYKKRKTFSFSSIGLDDPADTLTDDLIDSSVKAELNEMIVIIQSLPDDHAELIQLRYIEGLSVEEIATVYDERPNTISVKIHRIMNQLRNQL